jgi:hypothetical protein
MSAMSRLSLVLSAGPFPNMLTDLTQDEEKSNNVVKYIVGLVSR